MQVVVTAAVVMVVMVMVMVMIMTMVALIMRNGQISGEAQAIHQQPDHGHENCLIKGNGDWVNNPLHTFKDHDHCKQGKENRACEACESVHLAGSEAVTGVCRKAPCVGVGKDGNAQSGGVCEAMCRPSASKDMEPKVMPATISTTIVTAVRAVTITCAVRPAVPDPVRRCVHVSSGLGCLCAW